MYVVIGLYDGVGKAQHAVSELVKSGTPRQAVRVTTHEFASGPPAGGDGPWGDGHIFGRLNAQYPEGDVGAYTSEILKGGTVVTLESPSEDSAEVTESVMRGCGAARVERRSNGQGQPSYPE